MRGLRLREGTARSVYVGMARMERVVRQGHLSARRRAYHYERMAEAWAWLATRCPKPGDGFRVVDAIANNIRFQGMMEAPHPGDYWQVF